MQEPARTDTGPLVIDKELSNLLPTLTGEQYEALEKSILREGCRDPLVVWLNQGQMILLGGHNRQAICRQHGISYRVIVAENVTSRLDAMIWVLRDQLGKRNLSDFARAILALRLEDSIRKQAKENQILALRQNRQSVQENSPKRGINTREAIARLAGVSSNTISKVKLIGQNAPASQIVELENGKISINRVHHQLTHSENLEIPTEISRLIKRFRWSSTKDIVPSGSKLLAYGDALSPDQKKTLLRTVAELTTFLEKMTELLQINIKPDTPS